MSRKQRTAHRALIPFLLLGASGCAIFEQKPALKVDPVETQLAALPSPDDVYYQAAVRAISRRDYATALDYLQGARNKQPDDVRVWNAFGVVYDKLGRFDLSANYYAEAEKLDPKSAIVAANLAYSARLQGKPAAVAALPENGKAATAANPKPATAADQAISTAAVKPKAQIVLGFPSGEQPAPEPVAVLSPSSAAATPVGADMPAQTFAFAVAEPSTAATPVVLARPPAGPLVTVPMTPAQTVAAAALEPVRDGVGTILPPPVMPARPPAGPLITVPMTSAQTVAAAALEPVHDGVGTILPPPVMPARPPAGPLVTVPMIPAQTVAEVALEPVHDGVGTILPPPVMPARPPAGPLVTVPMTPAQTVAEIALEPVREGVGTILLPPAALPVMPARPPAGPLVTVPMISTQTVAALALPFVRDKAATIVPPHALPIARAAIAPVKQAEVPEAQHAAAEANWPIEQTASPGALHHAETKVALATPPAALVRQRQIRSQTPKRERPRAAAVTEAAQPSRRAAVAMADLAATIIIPYAPGKAPAALIRAKTGMQKALLIGKPLVIINASGDSDATERMREHLVSRGWSVPRSEPSKAERQTQTTIVFEPADIVVAHALARTLPFPAQLESCRTHCDGVRLVLGRDVLKAHFVQAASAAPKRG